MMKQVYLQDQARKVEDAQLRLQSEIYFRERGRDSLDNF
jgi:hypothetical protein